MLKTTLLTATLSFALVAPACIAYAQSGSDTPTFYGRYSTGQHL